MPIPGNLLTTAMAVMPHTDPKRAQELALTLDIPYQVDCGKNTAWYPDVRNLYAAFWSQQ